MDRGAWWATVHGVAKSWARLKRLSTQACITFIVKGKKYLEVSEDDESSSGASLMSHCYKV